MRLAERAATSPAATHVLLIDEINRGNLPKILGELLYLLEYREDEVSLMYGDEGGRFSLPNNLLVVGTMNTADRSIGLIDAALRRRFHFVPLFPERPPLAGLLSRWLARERPQMAWAGGVVDRLNARLRERVGPHLQVGHSYFMRKDLSPSVLRHIWQFDVLPFLEDQLFGQEAELELFSLEALGGAPPATTGADDGAALGGAAAGTAADPMPPAADELAGAAGAPAAANSSAAANAPRTGV